MPRGIPAETPMKKLRWNATMMRPRIDPARPGLSSTPMTAVPTVPAAAPSSARILITKWRDLLLTG